jgi:hypothetical protein
VPDVVNEGGHSYPLNIEFSEGPIVEPAGESARDVGGAHAVLEAAVTRPRVHEIRESELLHAT